VSFSSVGRGSFWSWRGCTVDLGNGSYAIVDDYTGRTAKILLNTTDFNGNIYVNLNALGYGTITPCSVTSIIESMHSANEQGYTLDYHDR
jgi:hypothetical protein